VSHSQPQSILANSILGEIYFAKKLLYVQHIAVPKASLFQLAPHSISLSV
jgi:hypothetical protein